MFFKYVGRRSINFCGVMCIAKMNKGLIERNENKPNVTEGNMQSSETNHDRGHEALTKRKLPTRKKKTNSSQQFAYDNFVNRNICIAWTVNTNDYMKKQTSSTLDDENKKAGEIK